MLLGNALFSRGRQSLKCGAYFTGSLVTPCRFFFQTPGNDDVEASRKIQRKRARRIAKNRIAKLIVRFPMERAVSRGHFVDHRAKRPDIRERSRRAALNLLWRHIRERAPRTQLAFGRESLQGLPINFRSGAP